MKLKDRFWRLVSVGLMFGGIWLASLLPAELFEVVANVALVLSFILFVALVVLYMKKSKIFACVFLLLLCPYIGYAKSVDDCTELFKSSPEEGNWCVYDVHATNDGAAVCNYIKTFDPNKAAKDQDIVNKADLIVQATLDLDEGRKSELTGHCVRLTEEEHKKSVKERQKILSRNSTPFCCAEALQTLNQMHVSRNEERQVETVPMMLADESMQCWPCDIVYMLIVLGNEIAFRVLPAMSAAGIFFLKWFFVFWLLLKVGMLFTNRTLDLVNQKQNGKEYGGMQFFKELIARILCVALAGLLLLEGASQLNKKVSINNVRISVTRNATALEKAYVEIVNPVFEFIAGAGVELSESLLRGKDTFYGKLVEAVKKQPPSVSVYALPMEKMNYCKSTVHLEESYIYKKLKDPTVGFAFNIDSSNSVINKDLTKGLLCMVQLSFQGMSPISASGSIILSHAIVNGKMFPMHLLSGRIPLMPEIFVGLFLTIIFWLFGVAVAFRLIDIMVRLIIVIVLCPIFIATAAFPLTRTYSAKAVNFFVSAVMGFIEVSLAVGIISPFFYTAVADVGKEDKLINAMVAPSNSRYVPNLYEQYAERGFMFVILLSCVAWMAYALLKSCEGFFATIFGLKKMSGIASSGTMDEATKLMRQNVGEVYDFGKEALATPLGAVNKLYQSGKAAGTNFYNQSKSVMSRGFDRTTDRVGNGLDRGGKAVGRGINAAGRAAGMGMRQGGISMIQAGADMCPALYGLGSLVGIPVMALGGLVWLGGVGVQAAGKVGEYGSRAAGKVAKYGVKAAAKVVKTSAKIIEKIIKTSVKMAKEQTKKALYQFFHPEDQ